LPVIFVCENNGYAMGTSVSRTTNQLDIYKMGLAFDMPSKPVDGMDVVAVHNAMDEAVERARKGEGPTFLEIRTYRYKGHSMSDPAKYRTQEELEKYHDLEPVVTSKAPTLKKKHASQKWFEELEAEVKAVVDDPVKFAEESTEPELEELYKDVHAKKDYPFVLA